ncbi:MAG TPA: helix-turn-helix transcriptional regulator [Spirochaetota bacterium]|nr:helix-turn-helix transcriptional regulator [Spirochaetota bacterium]HNT12739.1 helix-turn-helix transcriptional regulator [Spirochaetota bacterium]
MYGEKIRKLRKERGLKLEDMSKITGHPTSTIGYWEKQQYPDLGYIVKACDYFKINIWDFFVNDNDLAKVYKISPGLLDMCRLIEELPEDKQLKLLRLISTAVDAIK